MTKGRPVIPDLPLSEFLQVSVPCNSFSSLAPQQEEECARQMKGSWVRVCELPHLPLESTSGAIGELAVPLSFMSLLESTFTSYHLLLSGSFFCCFLIACTKYPTENHQLLLLPGFTVSNKQILLPDFSFLIFLQELWTWVANSPQVATSLSSRPL